MSAAEQGLLSFLETIKPEKPGDMLRGMNRYLDRIARERGVPLRGTFELTPYCNLDCKMCYVHLTPEQVRKTGKKILSGAEWKQIMQQAIDAGMIHALLTGGEAMLHPDFDDIYLFLREAGIDVSVKTNGLLLSNERIEFFEKHTPREIGITIYGCNDETYQNVCGSSVFSEVTKGIERARQHNLPVVISVTPNKYMLNNSSELLRYVMSSGLLYSVNSSLSVAREETGRSGIDHDLSLEEYIALYQQMNEIAGIKLQPVPKDKLPESGGKHVQAIKGFSCAGGRSSFAITWYGQMQPCLTYTGINSSVVDSGFTAAWRKVNEAVRSHLMPQECAGCAYEKICPVCPALHETGAPIGRANPEICMRAKRFVEEGLTQINMNCV